jgi:LacI family transcriptional regulator
MGDFAYSSTKSIVSGVIRGLSSRPDVELVIHGAHPSDDDTAYGFDTDVDGVITCRDIPRAFERRLVAARNRCPFVFINMPCILPYARRRSVSLVCDDDTVAAAAATLLVRHDLTEFGYVGSRIQPSWATWNISRRESFIAHLAERGFSTHVYTPTPKRAGARSETAALAAWLRALPKPCGLFVSYDQRAMRVLNICRAVGIAVPEQIQIVGADNEQWICESTSPTLSSIEPDFEGCGFRAAEALLEMMDGAPGGRTETFGVRRVVQRMSTTDAHGSASRAVRARDWIRSHAGEPLTVAQLARKMCCSVRTLQRSYVTVFGTTVWDDIAEARMEKAQRLLVETKTPVGEIAELVGFESSHHFAHFFKAKTGMSMRDWRRNANGAGGGGIPAVAGLAH